MNLRTRPAVALLAIQWTSWFVLPALVTGSMPYAVGGAALCTLLILLWWIFLSQATWTHRLAILAVAALSLLAARQVAHPSVQGGMMGLMFFFYATPLLCAALVAGTTLRRSWLQGLLILLAAASMTLIRTGGIAGDGSSDLHWRWTPTPEQKLLLTTNVPVSVPETPPSEPAAQPVQPAQPRSEPASPAPPPSTPPLWPGFRGSARDGNIPGQPFQRSVWASKPPTLLWRQPVGPAWSSFAAGPGNLIYTQQQRGDFEEITAIHLQSGTIKWTHRTPARFYESNAGPGPRGTPTLHDGRVYALGATGVVTALDARTGAKLWSRSAAEDTGAPTPGWGFAASPLIVDGKLIIAASGRLIAYQPQSGEPLWQGPNIGSSYSSPHLFSIAGTEQIVLLTGQGAHAFSPSDGALLWKHEWDGGAPILQPAQTPDGDLIVAAASASGGAGLRRLRITHGQNGWSAEPLWTSSGLKPYFNDFVIHNGHAYGFDGAILSCIDLADGKRKWKGGRYGHGQMLLIPEQDLLFILSEEGELALVAAKPDQFTEIGPKVPAIEGKTWNHPVLIGNTLLVRNGEQMAAFRLP